MTTKRLELVINQRGGLSARRALDGVARAARSVARSGRELRQGAGQGQRGLRDLEGQSRRTTGALGGLRGALTAAAVLAGARAVAQTADSYIGLENRIRVVTKSSEELKAVQAALFQQSRDIHQPVKASAEIYQRFAVATDGLALSHKELLVFTENLQRGISLSGRSAEETRGALVQLGQGMATNFQAAGQELRSLQEGAPELAKAIAEAAGGSAGELLQMAQDGKITRDLVVKAVTDMGVTLDEQWAKRIPPLADGWQDLGTSITKVIGEVDRATGVTRGLGGAMSSLADELEEIIPDLTDTVSILGELGAFQGIFSKVFEGASFETSVSNLQFMNLMLAGIVDRLVAVGTLGGGVFQGLKSIFGGRGSTAKEREEFVGAFGTLGTGVGGATKNLLDSIASRGAAKLGPGSGAPDPLDATVGGAARAASPGKTSGKSFSTIMGELRQEHELLKLTNDERSIAEDLLQAQSAAKGRLGEHQLDQIEHQLRENQLLEVAKQSIDDRLKLELEVMEKEAEAAREASRIAGERASKGMNEAAARNRGFRGFGVGAQIDSFGDDFAAQRRTMAQEQFAEVERLGTSMAQIFGPGGTLEQGLGRVGTRMSDLVGHAIAFGAPWKDTEQAIKQVGQTILAEVISSIIQTTVQMGIQAATAESIKATATATSVAQANTIAASMAPAAAATSLATGGTNGIGATAAILGAVALAGTAFAAGSLFREGGYTGDGGRAEVSGLVHGQEFVVNAEATRRHRDTLEAMNAGAGLRSGGGLVVNVIDQAGGVDFQTRQVDEGTVEVIARRILQQEGPRTIAADMRSNHGETARAITQTTNASRSLA